MLCDLNFKNPSNLSRSEFKLQFSVSNSEAFWKLFAALFACLIKSAIDALGKSFASLTFCCKLNFEL